MARNGSPLFAVPPEALPVGSDLLPAAPAPSGTLDVPADPPSILDALDPRIRAWMNHRAAPDLAGLAEAQAQDRSSARANALGANLTRAAALFRGEGVGAPTTVVPSAVKDWMQRQKATDDAEGDPLQRLKVAFGVQKDLTPRPVNPEHAPASDSDRAALQKAGIDPALAATHSDALALLKDKESRDARGAAFDEQKRHNAATERTSRDSLNFRTGQSTGSNAKDIADAIEAGEQSPILRGLYKETASVRAELHKRGFNLAAAERDWNAVQRHVATLNGPQQERLRQAIQFTEHQIGNIEDLYAEWQKLAPTSGFKVFNRAAMAAAKQAGGKIGAVATNLEAQIADLTSEMANVYMGGNSPTDHAMQLASKNLSADWDEHAFKLATSQIKKNLALRRNAMLESPAAGVSPNSPYTAPVPAPTSGAPAGASAPAPSPHGAVVERRQSTKRPGVVLVKYADGTIAEEGQ